MSSVIYSVCSDCCRCKLPGVDNDTYAVQDDLHSGLIGLLIPTVEGGYDECHYYQHSNDSITGNLTQQLVKCDEYVYDRAQFVETTITQVNRVVGSKAVFREPLADNASLDPIVCLDKKRFRATH